MVYPSTIDSFTNPSGTNTVDVVDHALQHTNHNTTIIAIENVVGTTNGTNVLKNFAAGDFPARINASGTLQQAIGGGTINLTTLGTPTLLGVPNNYSINSTTANSGTAQAFTSIDVSSYTKSITTTNSNKVRVSFTTEYTNNSTANPLTTFQILRGVATVAQVTHQQPNPVLNAPISLICIDSPPTGANTYDVKYKVSAGTFATLQQGGITNFTLEEIKAG